MRIARVIGTVTLSHKHPSLRPGRLMIADALDQQALIEHQQSTPRSKPMPESLVALDLLGAGIGQLVAISEGREACAPFFPDKVLIDAYCAAILDNVDVDVDIEANVIKHGD